MPRGNQMPAENQLVKLLLVAPSKAGKTHYAMQAAAAGFNLLFLDGDVGRPTIQSFTSETLNRIWYMDLGDSQTVARMYQLTNKMFKTPNYLWDDTRQETLKPENIDTSEIWEINLGLLTHRDILVIDTWTSLVNSIKKDTAKKCQIDLQNIQDGEGRTLYGNGNHKCDFLLQCIQSAKCHIIVNAHPAEYEHKIKPKGLVKDQKEKDMKVEYIRKIPASISNPHGNKMGKYFTDVCWLSPNLMGKRTIDGRPDPDRESGGRFNKIKDTSEYSFARLVKEAGGIVPETRESFPLIGGVKEYAVGEYKTPESSATKKGVLVNKGGAVKLSL